mmetsp:Transcript_9958/g.14661  ORF Transcript_9958/g.14661 Transcript_9958/m.14661 type:complete len:101 (+) Transcript_9958:62-364(+)
MATVPRIISNKTVMTGMSQHLKSFSLFEPGTAFDVKRSIITSFSLPHDVLASPLYNTMKTAPMAQKKITNSALSGIGLDLPPSRTSAFRKAFFVDRKQVR